MYLVALIGWLSLLTTIRSASAFSVSSDSNKRTTTASHKKSALRELRMVSSVETTSVDSMPKGMGGRIEDAFTAAKEKGEAAFVTFVTAGYPSAKGKKQKH